MSFYNEYVRPERGGTDARRGGRARQRRQGRAGARERQFGDFECRHCQQHVAAAASLARVNNRNHCPYCLWSKHVDLHRPGDRLAACKRAMEPVGLALKQAHKKYAAGAQGELLIAHQCTGCGALSINRLAADDGTAAVWAVFERGEAQPGLRARAAADGIGLLGEGAREVVRTRLFGKASCGGG